MKRPKSRAAIISIILIGLLIFGGVVFAWNTALDLFAPASDSTKPISIEVRSNESISDVANDLQQKGLIRSATAFRIWSHITGLDHQLQPGFYNQLKLTPSMSTATIVDHLLHAQPDTIKYTIIEGYRIEQIANTLDDGQLVYFNKSDFLKYAEHPSQFPDQANYPLLQDITQTHQCGQDFAQECSMEGLLFATTYQIPAQSTARDAINLMLQETNTVLAQNNIQPTTQDQFKNVYDLISLASIVEREARLNYRPQIASVYWNRLFKPTNETVGYLDADPTSQYGRDTANPPTTYWSPIDDVHIDGPYNTYDNTIGLPPTPICSPGLLSLQAAAAPADTNYYYFFTSTDGNDYFAETQAQINQLEAEHPVS